MDFEKNLADLKKQYIRLQPPVLVQNGWLALSSKLEEQKMPALKSSFTKVALATFVILILSATGAVTLAQKSLPGEKLYPLKLATENVITKTSGDQSIKIERRAQEVIDLAQKDDQEHLREASQKYQQTVEDTKKEIPDQKKEEFKKRLHDQEEQFSQTLRTSPQAKDELEDAIDAAKRGQNGEVKGIRNRNRRHQ